MHTTKTERQQDRVPLIVRFAATHYEHPKDNQSAGDSRISFSPFGEHTNTFAPTTNRGNDNDKTDQQRD